MARSQTVWAGVRWSCGGLRFSRWRRSAARCLKPSASWCFFCALQGFSTGAGIVVSRAVIRDMFAPAETQKVMSQVTIYFGVAPALAPMIGGWLFVHLGWHSIFWFLTVVSAALWIANYKLLPETLHLSQRQPFEAKHLMRGYWQLGSSPRFLLLAVASGVPFNGMFSYVLSAPAFLGDHLQLAPSQFFWFFALTISGIMAGAWTSGRMAGRIPPKQQIRYGFLVMLVVSPLNVTANVFFAAHVAWAMFTIAVFAFGWALMVPVCWRGLDCTDVGRRSAGASAHIELVTASVSRQSSVQSSRQPTCPGRAEYLVLASSSSTCTRLLRPAYTADLSHAHSSAKAASSVNRVCQTFCAPSQR